MPPVPRAHRRCAIILAGGEGTRLKSVTRRISGQEIPKQFCRLIGAKTLLDQTRERVSRMIPAERTVTVVTRAHERFYEPLLDDMPAESIAVQPTGRGTAPAILYALMRLAQRAPDAVVTVFPSDHYLSDDSIFMRHVEIASYAVDQRPELSVLLGMEPSRPEQSYGWIEPGEHLGIGEAALFGVRSFVEKPDGPLARRLMSEGALWNSFVMTARVSTMIGLFMIAAPGLYVAFNSIRAALGTAFEAKSVERLYAQIPDVNFSHEVLEKCPVNLAVIPVREVHWSDLGDPERVQEAWTRTGFTPEWASA